MRKASFLPPILLLALLPGPAPGQIREAPPSPDTLRILAYNTHHGEGMDGVLDLERIARVIRSVRPEVVALQEIDREVERTGGVDQAAVYGELTEMEPLFGDFMPYQGGDYGMAILSRLPVVEWTNHQLPPGAEPRSAVTARVLFEESGREVVVSSIHFYRTEEERLAQARTLVEKLGLAGDGSPSEGEEAAGQEAASPRGEDSPADTPTVILAGDFNSRPGTAVMDYLVGYFSIPEKTGPPYTFPADSPAREIDFVLLQSPRGVRVLEYRVLDEAVASDHRPVFMVLELR